MERANVLHYSIESKLDIIPPSYRVVLKSGFKGPEKGRDVESCHVCAVDVDESDT